MCDYCCWIDQILARIREEIKTETTKTKLHVDPVVIVHGGAGKIPWKERQRMLLEVKNAAIEAYSALINGRSAVDAVEKGISYMESQPLFNCAKGGSLDVNDEIVMDAGMMTVKDAGCVGAVRDIEHPITLARKVLENTEHVLIVESGAQKFALDHGIPILPPGALRVHDSLISDYSNEQESFESCTTIECPNDLNQKEHDKGEWQGIDGNEKCDSNCVLKRSIEGEAYPCRTLSFDSDFELLVPQVGAVGVVAFDRKKRLASGTSTAGESRKPIGSISATGTVIGCGIYTDEHGCVSVSGNDTNIYCYAPARRIIRNLSRGAAVSIAGII
nr:PREDICTED: isoaspartyl peptidase/L-asparaginase-like [Megachile rotundata]